jgi:Ca2+-binding RTX toxin-like protein
MAVVRISRSKAGRLALVLAGVLVLSFGGVAHADPTSCATPLPRDGTTFEGHRVIWGEGSIEGTSGDDFIVGSERRDTVRAGYGNDIVCALAGDDVVYGGGSGDDLHGQEGDDHVFGELLDDKLYGGPDRDVLIGGHGTDEMEGGTGNDWLRGGTNGDTYRGGSNEGDNDVASFAATTPSAGHAPGVSGIAVNMTDRERNGVRPNSALGEGVDTVTEIESVIGSPFNDVIDGRTAVKYYGGMGTDSCTPEPCDEPGTHLTAPFAYLDQYTPFTNEPTPDPIFVVVDGGGAETLEIASGEAATTLNHSITGGVATLAPCQVSGSSISCPLAASSLAGLVALYGAGGNDVITMGSLPNGRTSDIDGGEDSDTIRGGSGGDVIYSGNSGSDTLQGGDGADALIAEGSGGDDLIAGEGNDQLVTTDPCQGHTYSGGNGQDVAGFARTVPGQNGVPQAGEYGINATIGGSAYVLGEGGTGNICASGASTSVEADSEILEGTMRRDVLSGDETANTLWGRDGHDTLFAHGDNDLVLGQKGQDILYGSWGEDRLQGGEEADTLEGGVGADTLEGLDASDILYGQEGNDTLFGGAENDTLYGGEDNDLVRGDSGLDWLYGQAGNDRLRARDGARDQAVNCGDNTDEPTEHDENDPLVNCE